MYTLCEMFVFKSHNLIYGSKCSQMKKRLEVINMWYYHRTIRIPWTEHVINEEVWKETGTTKNLIITIIRRQLTFPGHIKRKECLANLTLTGRSKDKRRRKKIASTVLNEFPRMDGK